MYSSNNGESNLMRREHKTAKSNLLKVILNKVMSLFIIDLASVLTEYVYFQCAYVNCTL